MLAAPAKLSPYFSSCWLHRQKCSSIFRHAGCIGKNIAVFFVMLTASAKISTIFCQPCQGWQIIRLFFASPARVSE
jgi:hypothetical protein